MRVPRSAGYPTGRGGNKSQKKARETLAKAHGSAAQEHGEGARAYRVAAAAVKHELREAGDHWEEKRAPEPLAFVSYWPS
jgi:hypothetical protein